MRMGGWGKLLDDVGAGVCVSMSRDGSSNKTHQLSPVLPGGRCFHGFNSISLPSVSRHVHSLFHSQFSTE